MDSNLEPVSTDGAPEAIGPYSQAVICGGWILTSGQIALDPATQLMVDGGIQEQTHRVFQNLTAVMNAAGSSLADVARCTVYLKDMGDFAAVNAIYAEYFSSPYPARATIQAAALPKDALVEIDCMAKVGHRRYGTR
ncbi:MAG: hypothetical protein CMJ83_19075 [Planctomycetes bacterium]|nr:hypothetical protein [Planctomycetota bacterium]